jgi:hypothetical protein
MLKCKQTPYPSDLLANPSKQIRAPARFSYTTFSPCSISLPNTLYVYIFVFSWPSNEILPTNEG